MYDRYIQALPITANTKLPNHKGILISNSNGSTAGITFSFYNDALPGTGNTFRTRIAVTTGTEVLPFQIYSLVDGLPTGVTAFYVN